MSKEKAVHSAVGLCLIGVLLPFSVSVAPCLAAAVVSFDPLNGTIAGPADTLAVDVTVDAGAVDLRGFTLVFEFDPDVAVPVSVEAGSLLAGAGCPDFFAWLNETAVGDSIAVDGAGLGCSMVGPGAIIRLRFVGVEQGLSPLACRRSLMRDSANAEIAGSCANGTILYVGPTAAAPSTWGRLKERYR